MTPPRTLITAGPTHEPIDAVRYIANRSSGRMGIALAEAAAARGWPVTLLLGPTHLAPEHRDIKLHRFETCSDLGTMLNSHWPQFDLLIMAAAVADFRPVRQSPGKLRRGEKSLDLALEPTEDLLAHAAATARPDQRIVGFALEPAEELLDAAAQKLNRKGLHAIVANPLEAMNADTATAHLLLAGGRRIDARPNLPKTGLAEWLLDQIEYQVVVTDMTPEQELHSEWGE